MAGQVLPAFSGTTLTARHYLMDNVRTTHVGDVVLDSTNADAGSTPTYRIRPGNVMTLRASTGRYVEANDTNADAPTPAIVTALETADAGWQSATVTWTVDGGVSGTVVLGAADDTDAEVVTALNGNAVFRAHLVADVVAARVRVRTLEAGAHKTLLLSANDTGAGAYGASGTAATGTDPEVIVTDDWADLQDDAGTAIHAPVRAIRAAHFDLSELIVGGTAGNLRTAAPNAYAALVRQGSKFSS